MSKQTTAGKNRARLKSVLASALRRIVPSPAEEKRHMSIANKAIALAFAVVPNSIGIALTGSSAKGTSLSGSTDIDIFLLFPLTYPKHELSFLGLEYAKRAFRGRKTEIGYANHPYLRAWLGGYKIDVVPSYRIENASQLSSAVDRSPLHTKYVNSSLTRAQKNDVRLLKAFAKALGVYGAEARVEGFSGYLCELLVIKYGSFQGVLEAASAWNSPVIDIAGHHGHDKARQMFPQAAMVAIDPVDPNRNVSAVVSATSLYRLVYASRKFLQSPGMEYFFPKKQAANPESLGKIIRSRGTEIVAIEIQSPALVNDILWPQLKKTTLALRAHLEKHGFAPFGHYFYSDNENCLMLVECSHGSVPAIRKVTGPAVHMRAACEDFARKHRGSYDTHIEHDRIVSIEPSAFTTCWQALEDFARSPEKHGVPANFVPLLGSARKVGLARLLSEKYLFVAADYFTRKA
ncbi:MAG: CCA tRNA nucleotidyltransferase [Candidatus Micrarchaeia archaeon]